MKIAGIYMAAGAGRRMGEHKPSIPLLPGVSMGGMGLKTLLGAGLAAVSVVVRAGDDLEWLPDELRSSREAGDGAFRITVCGDSAMGMSFSLKCGLRSVMPFRPDAVVVMLADQPFVSGGLVKRIVRMWRQYPHLDYVAAGHGEALLPPVLLAGSMFPALLRLKGDQGARRLLASERYSGAAVRVSGGDEVMDVDAPGDLDRARRYAGQCRYVHDSKYDM
ncbi:NTP transferase domain-containing protein [Paenibacillus chartarius]|uniref:NTP transferase domain-containing protein n=1 Tax=Paenibacillus chartarius TaxID=747481 RepID=A0ABV6DH13_9BACL